MIRYPTHDIFINSSTAIEPSNDLMYEVLSDESDSTYIEWTAIPEGGLHVIGVVGFNLTDVPLINTNFKLSLRYRVLNQTDFQRIRITLYWGTYNILESLICQYDEAFEFEFPTTFTTQDIFYADPSRLPMHIAQNVIDWDKAFIVIEYGTGFNEDASTIQISGANIEFDSVVKDVVLPPSNLLVSGFDDKIVATWESDHNEFTYETERWISP